MKTKPILYLLLVLLLITACSGKKPGKVEGDSTKSSDFVFEEEKSIELAERGVLHMIKAEYDDFRKVSTDKLSEALSEEVLKEVETKVLNPSGEFEELVKHKYSEIKDKDGNKYAQVLVHAKYTKADRVFTVVIDTDYKISGFFVK